MACGQPDRRWRKSGPGKGEGGSVAGGRESSSWVVPVRRVRIRRGDREWKKRGNNDDGAKADRARMMEEGNAVGGRESSSSTAPARRRAEMQRRLGGEEEIFVGVWSSRRP